MANVTKQQVILEFNADTGGIDKGIQKTKKGVDDVSNATSGLTGQLDKMTGGAISGFRKFGGGLKTAVRGLKTFKVALASTGIGLIVVAIGTLVSYFKNTKRGAEQLKVATAALGAAFDVIKDRISALGGALVKFFTGDFKGALEDVQGAFSGVTDEIIRETKAAIELERRMNALKDAEREFNLVRAETTLEIAKTRLAVEDETKSYEERIKALDTAIALEQETVDEQLRLAKEREAIITAQVEQSESLEEDLQRQADARQAVIELETASLRTQKRLEGERQSLLLQQKAEEDRIAAAEEKRREDKRKAREKEAEDKQKAAEAELAAQAALEDELYALTLTAQEREELAAQQRYDKRVAIAGDNAGLLKAAAQQLQTDLAAIQKKADDAAAAEEAKRRKDEEKAKDDAAAKDKARREKELADELALIQQKRAMTFAALSALQELNAAFSSADEEGARRAFKRNKALSLASAVLNTSQAITDALAKDAIFPGSRFIAAATAGAAGLAQIQNIRKTQFQGSNPPPPATEDRGPAGGFATGAVNAPGAPTLDLGFLGEGAQGGPIQAYVIAQNVSNAQQANQQVQDQATLGG